eukprot:2688484-Pleurochrysis_carterae.AAC.1
MRSSRAAFGRKNERPSRPDETPSCVDGTLPCVDEHPRCVDETDGSAPRGLAFFSATPLLPFFLFISSIAPRSRCTSTSSAASPSGLSHSARASFTCLLAAPC